MHEIFVDTKFFKEEHGGARLLQRILIDVIARSVKDRLSNSPPFAHWTQSVLPDRIAMLLRRPFDDKLLREDETGMLQQRINAALYNENNKSIDAPLVLYFEILERRFLFEKIRNKDSRKKEEYVMMVFYESSPENPDERLQEITIDVFKRMGIFALVKNIR